MGKSKSFVIKILACTKHDRDRARTRALKLVKAKRSSPIRGNNDKFCLLQYWKTCRVLFKRKSVGSERGRKGNNVFQRVACQQAPRFLHLQLVLEL